MPVYKLLYQQGHEKGVYYPACERVDARTHLSICGLNDDIETSPVLYINDFRREGLDSVRSLHLNNSHLYQVCYELVWYKSPSECDVPHSRR